MGVFIFLGIVIVLAIDYVIAKKFEEIAEMKGHIDRSTPFAEYGKLLCGNQLKNVGLSLYIDGQTTDFQRCTFFQNPGQINFCRPALNIRTKSQNDFFHVSIG